MTASDDCPTPDILIAFHRGTLPRMVMDQIASHVIGCPACEARLTDSFSPPGMTRIADGTPPVGRPSPIPPSPSSFADKYRLGERLGAGGMGYVFRAEQLEPVRRVVAVKVMRPGLDTIDFLARFETERQAVARMDHPNIARVFDAGTTDQGQPYFALELVAGDNLVAHADARKLSVRERVALFVPVCRAVQHAHQKGVIHRDLKPSNVLVADVDGTAVPKVIDFGIAKAVADDPHAADAANTRPGLVIGTPEYMSPEQAGTDTADIDTRSDVYSLGVLLYELLTGTTPFTMKASGGSVWGLLQAIRDSDAPKPGTRLTEPAALTRGTDVTRLRRQLGGDLEWVVLKALARDRDRRYQTANALALDLERFLRNDPVEAGPPSRTYRFRKFVTRNRATVAATAAVVLAVVGGGVASAVGLIRSLESERVALTALDGEAKARAAAEASDRLAQDTLVEVKTALETAEAADRRTKASLEKVEAARVKLEAAEKQARADEKRALAAEATAKEQKDRAVKADAQTRAALFAATDVAIEELLASRRELSPAETGFLHQLRDLYAKIDADPDADPTQYMNGIRRLGMIHEALGARAEAEAVYRRAIAAIYPIAAKRPDDRAVQLAKVRANQRLGILYRRQNKVKEAEAAHRECSDVCKRMLDTLPDDHEFIAELARSHGNRAALLGDDAPPGRVIAELLDAANLFARLTEKDATCRRDEAVTRSNLAQTYNRLAKYDEALAELLASLKLREGMVADFPGERTHRDLAHGWLSLGNQYQVMGKGAEADQAFTNAVRFRREIAEKSPGVPDAQADYATALTRTAVGKELIGKFSQVREPLETAAALLVKLVEAHPDRPMYRVTLATTYATLADHITHRLGDPKKGLVTVMQGFNTLRPVNPRSVEELLYKQCLSLLLRHRAAAGSLVGRHIEAATDWMAADPLVLPQERIMIGAMIAFDGAKAGDTRQAAQLLGILAERDVRSPGILARMALAHAVIAEDADDKHATSAVKLLAKAVDGGFKDRDLLVNSPDLKKLAGRDDFKAVMAKLPAPPVAPLPRLVE